MRQTRHKQVINIGWGEACRNIRKHKPLRHLAKEIGCDEQTLTRLEREEVIEPRYSVGVKILEAHLNLMGADYHKKIMRQ